MFGYVSHHSIGRRPAESAEIRILKKSGIKIAKDDECS